ncbi:MAG: C69 family dipeptidase [Ilumatobacteraceae bacterium]
MCDCLVALPPATGRPFTLFAKNSDRPPDEQQRVEWNAPRRDREPVRVTHIEVGPSSCDTIGCLISRPDWCWGAEHGINEAGVAIGNEAIYTRLDPRTASPRLIGMDFVRLGLERAESAGEAVEVITGLLEYYGQGGSGHDPHGSTGPKAYWSSFLVADPTEAWVVETSGTAWAAEQVGEARAISNRTTIPAFDAAHRHPEQPVERFVDPRLDASKAVLADRQVTYGSIAAHLRSHECVEAGWSVCMHVDGVEVTTGSMIAELHADGAHRAWMSSGSPCTNEYVELYGSRTTVSPTPMRPGSSTVA